MKAPKGASSCMLQGLHTKSGSSRHLTTRHWPSLPLSPALCYLLITGGRPQWPMGGGWVRACVTRIWKLYKTQVVFNLTRFDDEWQVCFKWEAQLPDWCWGLSAATMNYHQVLFFIVWVPALRVLMLALSTSPRSINISPEYQPWDYQCWQLASALGLPILAPSTSIWSINVSHEYRSWECQC